ncbi:sugar transferase [Jeotgalibaca sp. A122]|uniref:sugar transferase n=1 Tax=Jeotgalibaca sp. A122 TaxID=3457322 RepID=UPI003FD5D12F
MYKFETSAWVKHFDFMVIDIIFLLLAFMISFTLRFGGVSPFSIQLYAILGVLMPILHIFIVFFTEEYSGILRRGYLKELKAVLRHNSILLASVVFFMFMTQQAEEYSRIVLSMMWVLSCLLMWGGRIFLKRALLHAYSQEKNQSYLLVISTQNSAEKTVEQLQKASYSSYRLKGLAVVDADIHEEVVSGIPVIASRETVMDYLRFNTVDGVFIDANVSEEEIDQITENLVAMGITVHISLDHISSEMPNRVVEEINGYSVLTTSIKMATTRQLFIKRVIDICGGLVGLVATVIAFVIFAPIIYIQSPGPIFFSQERVGRNGRRFRIYKFRSMYMDAEERKKELMAQNKMDGFMFKMDNDPRIMPIGRFIRRVSVDELPQSINILKGDMSLVGTRPPTVDEYERYELHHKRRLAAKPGLTGMWQVSGRSDITDFEEVVALDTEYISNFTLSLYFKILFKTVGVVLGKKGSV